MLAATLFWVASAARAATFLELLQPGASITHGGLVFYNFRNVTQSGDLSVGLDSIAVEPVTDAPVPTEFGLRFSSAQWTLAGPNLVYDLSFDYNVRTLSGLPLITENTLRLTGGAIGNGSASVTEDVVDQLSGTPLVTKIVFFDENNQTLQDHKDFPAGPYTEVDIGTSFHAATGAAAGSRVFVSHFDATFAQVPETGPTLLAGFSLLMLTGWNARSRARRGTAR
jgi:hypothetical protein